MVQKAVAAGEMTREQGYTDPAAQLDFLYDEEVGFRICEVNSSPGFEGLEQACDVDVAAALFQYLDVKFRISAKARARILEQSKKDGPAD